MAILLLITPGIIASLYYCKQKKIPLASIEFLAYIIIFAFLIFIFISGIAYLRGHKDGLTLELFSLIGNAARYGILGLIASLAFPNMLILFEKIWLSKKK